ncbi:MAG: replication initiation factor domain-containing protein [Oscillospiraceae bacterium]|nr:replication initiation factor domain-containing protein [Oscillospiraceae bacterium]
MELIIDWLSFSLTGYKVQEMIQFLGLEQIPLWTRSRGKRGYALQWSFGNIYINFTGSSCWVEMSGGGCRQFEQLTNVDWVPFLQKLKAIHANITRLDVAYDDKDGTLDVRQIAEDTKSGNYVGYLRKKTVMISGDRDADKEGVCCTFGSKTSEVLIRIYDKAAEQRVSGPWVRVELQMRHDRANAFVELLQKKTIEEAYLGAVRNYLRFTEPSKDSNLSRRPMRAYWSAFLNSADSLSLSQNNKDEATIESVLSYVRDQAGNAIDCVIQIFGVTGLLTLLKSRMNRTMERYLQIVHLYGLYSETNRDIGEYLYKGKRKK